MEELYCALLGVVGLAWSLALVLREPLRYPSRRRAALIGASTLVVGLSQIPHLLWGLEVIYPWRLVAWGGLFLFLAASGAWLVWVAAWWRRWPEKPLPRRGLHLGTLGVILGGDLFIVAAVMASGRLAQVLLFLLGVGLVVLGVEWQRRRLAAIP